uniref:U3 small nucleolar ribonucleoprotein LCP5 n=1 Tax=Rhipicephalus zambeziensis TaxID=60191 RepID=A0A224Z956_9ACAR
MSQVTVSDRIEKELPEFLAYLKDVKDKASGVSAAVESLLSRVKNKRELSTAAVGRTKTKVSRTGRRQQSGVRATGPICFAARRQLSPD